ncbi:hypothetical protein PI126_g14005 [Phytophthora idaei]|nr:hypothetical protein PI126_g14005 [Phytophthora idaei]
MPRDKLDEWLTELGDGDPPLDGEDEVRIEGEDSSMKDMMLKLLRAYREVSTNKGDCPPMTTLDVQHHINTGNAAPIMLNRRCQAQTGDAIVESNVTQTLRAGIIEENNGGGGFPVVLVREKGRRALGAVMVVIGRTDGEQSDNWPSRDQWIRQRRSDSVRGDPAGQLAAE